MHFHQHIKGVTLVVLMNLVESGICYMHDGLLGPTRAVCGPHSWHKAPWQDPVGTSNYSNSGSSSSSSDNTADSYLGDDAVANDKRWCNCNCDMNI